MKILCDLGRTANVAESVEDEQHEQLQKAIAVGRAVEVSRGERSDGTFQVAAVVRGGDLVISEWRRNLLGMWRPHAQVRVDPKALPRLGELLVRNSKEK